MVHGYLSIGIGIISLFSISFSYILLKKANGVIKIPTIASFFMLKYLIVVYIGAVLLNIFYFEYEDAMGFYSRPDLLLNIWIYSTMGLYLIPIGMLIFNIIVGYQPLSQLKMLSSRKIHYSKMDISNSNFWIILFLFIISIYILLIYRSKLGELPILGLFSGSDTTEMMQLRSKGTNAFIGKLYRFNMIMRILPLVLMMITFFLKNVSVRYKQLLYLLIAYNVFVALMDFQKAPIINVIILILLAHFYYKSRIKKKEIYFGCTVAIILIFIMYIFFMGLYGRGALNVIHTFFHRIFIGEISPFYSWQLYQEEFGYLYGTSFPNPAGMFPFEHTRITVEISKFTHPEIFELGIVGSSPTVFFADWFINFGPFMTLFSMVLFGIILQLVDISFINHLLKKKSLLISVLFIYLIIYFSKFVGSSYVGIIIDEGLIFPVLIILFIYITQNCILNLKKLYS